MLQGKFEICQQEQECCDVDYDLLGLQVEQGCCQDWVDYYFELVVEL